MMETCLRGDTPNVELAQLLSGKYASAAHFKAKRVCEPTAGLLTNAVQVLETFPVLHTMEALTTELMRLQLLSLPVTPGNFLDLVPARGVIEAKAAEGGVNADIVLALQSPTTEELVGDIMRVVGHVGTCFDISQIQAFEKMFDSNLDKVWSSLVGERVFGISETSLVRWYTIISIIVGGDQCNTQKSVVALLLFFFYLKEILVSKKGRGSGIQGCDKVRKWAIKKEKEGELIVPNIFKN
jgi:hypothetical protein